MTWIGNTRESTGYNRIMGEWRVMFDPADPWSFNLEWMFCIAERVYAETGECMPDFIPSPALDTPQWVPEGYPHEYLADALEGEWIGVEDMRRAFTIMSRYDDWCRRAGLNY